MEQKTHWAWPLFSSGAVLRERLHVHFEQEDTTYVRDFPVMVGWAYVQCPIAVVRRGVAGEIFGGEKGGVVAEGPPPRLVVQDPRGSRPGAAAPMPSSRGSCFSRRRPTGRPLWHRYFKHAIPGTATLIAGACWSY